MSRKTATARSVNVAPDLTTVRVDATEVAALAYELWCGRGCPVGSPEVDWFGAEDLLRAKTKAEPARTMTAAGGK